MSLNHSGYLEQVYTEGQLKKTVKKLHDFIKSQNMKYDAIAFRGSSGAAVAYPLSYITGIPLIYVRKTEERSHGRRIEATRVDKPRYIIVDDLIGTGDTIKNIVHAIEEYEPGSRCIGVFLYAVSGSSSYDDRSKIDIPIYYLPR